MAQTLLGRLAALDSEIAEHEAAIKKLKAKRGPLAEQCIDYMSRHSIMRQAVNGRTVYVSNETWVSKLETVSPNSFVDACRAHGFEDLTSYSPQRLTALYREWQNEGEEAPAWLSSLVEVSEVSKVKSRKS